MSMKLIWVVPGFLLARKVVMIYFDPFSSSLSMIWNIVICVWEKHAVNLRHMSGRVFPIATMLPLLWPLLQVIHDLRHCDLRAGETYLWIWGTWVVGSPQLHLCWHSSMCVLGFLGWGCGGIFFFGLEGGLRVKMSRLGSAATDVYVWDEIPYIYKATKTNINTSFRT